MAGKTLSFNDMIAANGQYTFRFSSDGVFKPDTSDLIGRLQAGQGGANMPIDQIAAQYEGGVHGLFASQVAISFVWTAPGWTVKQVAQAMEGAMDVGLGNLTYLSAVGGTDVTPGGNKPFELNFGTLAWFAIALVVVLAFFSALGSGVAKKV